MEGPGAPVSSVGRPPLPARSAVGPASSVTWGVELGQSASPSTGGQTSGPTLTTLFFFFFFWVTGELSTHRQLMKVPNEHGLSPNNGLENVSLSDQSMASNPRKGQTKCPGAKTTSHDGRAGHVMTHMCHQSKARRMASVTIQVPMQGICTPATRIALWPAKLPSQAMSSSRPRARWPVKTCEKRTCDNLGGCVQVKEEPNYN